MTHSWTQYISASWNKPTDAEMLAEIDQWLSSHATVEELQQAFEEETELIEQAYDEVESIVCKYHPEYAAALDWDGDQSSAKCAVVFGLSHGVEEILEDWAGIIVDPREGTA